MLWVAIIIAVVIVVLLLWWWLSRCPDETATTHQLARPSAEILPPAPAWRGEATAPGASALAGVTKTPTPEMTAEAPAVAAEAPPPAAAEIEEAPPPIEAEAPTAEVETRAPVPTVEAPPAEIEETTPAPVAETPTAEVEAPATVMEAEELPVAAAEPPQPDDLKVIEGIGPKILAMLNAEGIHTFAQLAATDVERLRGIMLAANLRIADPATWPQQAALAAAGKWDELQALQDSLKGGRKA